MIDEAVAQGIVETDDLDWKREVPPAKGIASTDFPKDVAAMANSGGGVIVYGIAEVQKAASSRKDIVRLTRGTRARFAAQRLRRLARPSPGSSFIDSAKRGHAPSPSSSLPASMGLISSTGASSSALRFATTRTQCG